MVYWTPTPLKTDDAIAALNKKEAMLGRRQILRQVESHPTFQEPHRRNNVWMHHLEKAREINGFVVERF
jgi:hypothetical protein